jgi:hypothetical protein
LWFTRYIYMSFVKHNIYLHFIVFCRCFFNKCPSVIFILFNCISIYCIHRLLIQISFFQDSAIIMLNKPPKLPVKVWMTFPHL